MPTGCTTETKLYISGGYKGPYRGHLDKMRSYSPARDQWFEHSTMNHPRSYHSMVHLHGKIIVAGGVNYVTAADSFEDVHVSGQTIMI